MRTLRASAAVITAIGATFAFAAPASATTYSVTNPAGDVARWNSDTNILTVCDNSSGNGTAKAVLSVIGGNTWQLFDSNGAQAGCASAGPLSVDETKSANLYVCASASSSCYGIGPVDL